MQLLPVFLIAAGVLVMLQPRTKRWQARMNAYFRGNEQRVKQRANTFFLLGLAFMLAGFAYLFRLAG
ncbi:hypothetical protein BAG01nite_25930 [Brevibacillus agri]|uniref:Uncharacterized protein n=1 Tax=Brevibacillus agri TaxID=51101 RepID=A0A3M8B3L8_9BACL|nr:MULTISPECIES: hypothetical protein [Brevibacillus]ELK43252.1 hypothetical protein D478_04351 [Brevibacillus agri BAB-2500]EJL43260.1 hypothetical protein PMI08_02805 [Brevibacillus sp. CF112]MBG9565954.1 membrane protein [Brevibacillus agri]MBY0054469.1 hypothetical protein [Brevibacillus agri]MCG5250923.1 hypothetical protein [Brevibacillus agri]